MGHRVIEITPVEGCVNIMGEEGTDNDRGMEEEGLGGRGRTKI